MKRANAIAAAVLLVLAAGAQTVRAAALVGDPARGEKIYSRCMACHSIDRNRTGPRHAGLFGRRAGSVPGFAYSPAMRKAGKNGLIWNAQTLDKFIKDPMKFAPGTRMGYAGVKDDQERADLIAYLKKATGSAKTAAAPAPGH